MQRWLLRANGGVEGGSLSLGADCWARKRSVALLLFALAACGETKRSPEASTTAGGSAGTAGGQSTLGSGGSRSTGSVGSNGGGRETGGAGAGGGSGGSSASGGAGAGGGGGGSSASGGTGADGGSAGAGVEASTWQLQAELDGDPELFFGSSVSLDQDTVLVGAVGGESGTAVVFVREGDTWTEQWRATPGSDFAGLDFGAAVSLDGNTALVGAPAADGGRAVVYVREGTVWSEQQELVPDDAVSLNTFGSAVAVSGDTALVGAPRSGNGSAWVFVREGGVWQEQDRWLPPEPGHFVEGYGNFGRSVALLGDTAMVSLSHAFDVVTTGVAQVFVREESSWGLLQTLESYWDQDTDQVVALSGNTALLAKLRTPIPSPGFVDAYVLEGSTFVGQQRLVSPDSGDTADFFGRAIAIDGDTAFITAGVDRFDLGNSGEAHIFVREQGEWDRRQKLLSPREEDHDSFGYAVSVDGDTAVVTAPGIVGEEAPHYAYVFTRQADL